MLEQRTMDLIKLEHQANEMDARNQATVGQSINALDIIDNNIDKVGRIMGRSKTVERLPGLERKDNIYRD